MKKTAPAYILLALVTLFVIVNGVYITKSVDGYIERLEGIDTESDSLTEELQGLYGEFQKTASVISLTVNHEDLTNIEDAFAEIIGAAEAKEQSEVIITKSRLVDALRHLRRLSGFNIESIF